MSYGDQSHIGMENPLSIAEVVCVSILDATADLDPSSSWKDKVDLVPDPLWVTQSSCSPNCLEYTLPSDESIVDAMYGPNRPWEDMHHRSYFFREFVKIKQDDFISTFSDMASHVMVPLDTHGIYAEGNMANISPTIMIDIS
jgi:hypothetical protein